MIVGFSFLQFPPPLKGGLGGILQTNQSVLGFVTSTQPTFLSSVSPFERGVRGDFTDQLVLGFVTSTQPTVNMLKLSELSFLRALNRTLH